ncbi:fatty acid desaturase [Lipingzhangella halophila]|uniref:Fatty acid desaturase n=1 Tax=Lipingzhangella halophila TaxID=1783352 RepID=A0A7W7RMQ0_9ACTN|nr:hypothetical protein [Lipingzhangella halophila]MBB4934286.1 fatty acid desaturase [Lipingzhangella halophila]
MRRGRVKAPLGSHERPYSALRFRFVLAVFGAAILLIGAVLAIALSDSPPLMIILAAGFVAACFNVYWVRQRLQHEQPG